jgi:hypothetical protein
MYLLVTFSYVCIFQSDFCIYTTTTQIDMLNHSLTPHVALGRHETITSSCGEEVISDVSSSSSSSRSSDNSFELRMIRDCEENEEIFSTYDKQGTRTASSWLLNYGFVPSKLSHEEVAVSEGTSGSSGAAAYGCDDDGDKSKSDKSEAREALKRSGPHTHGALRL